MQSGRCKAGASGRGVTVRITLILLAGLALLWSAAWFTAARTLERAAETWFAETAAAGLLAGYDHLSVGGWPVRLELRVEGPRLRDPLTGVGWRGEILRAGVSAWAPHRLWATPEGKQTLWVAGTELALEAEALRAEARLALPAGRVDRLAVDLDGGDVRGAGPGPLRVARGRLRADLAEDMPWVTLELERLDPEGLGLAQKGWPDEISPQPSGPVTRLAGRVAVDPSGTGAGLPWPPARIELAGLALDWGDTRLRADGGLDIAPEGWPEGRIALQAEDWAPLLALAVTLGAVGREVAPTWLQVLAALEEAGDVPGLLEVPLIFQGGRMSFGPLPLGPAPRLAPPVPAG